MHVPEKKPATFLVDQGGCRLDHFLVHQLPEQSRSSFKHAIKQGAILVNDRQVKAGYRLKPGDRVTVAFPPAPPAGALVAEPVSFDTLYEDRHLIVIAKPPGVVVHPAAGHSRGTLVQGLLYRYGDLATQDAERPGIVHRLDKDTSGVMVVARTSAALQQLAADFKDRRVSKVYLALLARCPPEPEGRLVAPVGRHPVHRKKMAIRHHRGRYAVTRWRTRKTFAAGPCLVEIIIETGRTHQIRVHMASLGAPVLGDRLYGGRGSPNSREEAPRQMLHAWSLSFNHPVTGRSMQLTAPLWPDFQQVLHRLSA